MTKHDFQKLLHNSPVLLDGALGTNLYKAGMPSGVCPEKWILENESVCSKLLSDYANAGSQIVYAPTFTCNAIKMKEYGYTKYCKDWNTRLVAMAKNAVGSKALVAGDLTMTGRQLTPYGTLPFEELINVYKEQIRYLFTAGVDLLVVETMMSLQEARAAIIAAKETCELPVMVTLTFEKNGRTMFGSDPATAAIVLSSLGADAVGANCSAGPAEMLPVIEEMKKYSRVPIIAKPNAGLPKLNAQGDTYYDLSEDDFALGIEKLIKGGASIVGGCCGTAPSYIRALKAVISGIKNEPNRIDGDETAHSFLSTERASFALGQNQPFFIIGERINPTGKKKFQASLLEGSLSMVNEMAADQTDSGAKMLDINFGMPGIDEKAVMERAIIELCANHDAPLCVDTSDAAVMEAALRLYPGRALMNSISLETAKINDFLPLAQKYGAMFILLPLSDDGLPESLADKKRIIAEVEQKAAEYGLCKKDFIIDALVTSAGADSRAGQSVLETIRYCKENGYLTSVGLSNISFGMPQRNVLNSVFLDMAISAGLSMAIANPCVADAGATLALRGLAADVILGKDGGQLSYIEAAKSFEEQLVKIAPVAKKTNVSNTSTASNAIKAEISENTNISGLSPHMEALKKAIVLGSREKSVTLTHTLLDSGESARSILDDALIPAINEVGDLFAIGKYFLPQLINSANAMEDAVALLEPHLAADGQGEKLPAVIIATVKGDIHDIGKNLVALMLKNYGFQVIDLGKDVPTDTIIAESLAHNAKLIALSALMTTTMKEMENVINTLKERNIDIPVIIGGAAVTKAFADKIGATGYSKDAAEAVKLAARVLHLI